MIYITRDLWPGEKLCGFIDIWSEKPVLIDDFGGPQAKVWVSDPDDWLRHKLTVLTVEECRELYGVVPDFVNEMITCGVYRLPATREKRNAKDV